MSGQRNPSHNGKNVKQSGPWHLSWYGLGRRAFVPAPQTICARAALLLRGYRPHVYNRGRWWSKAFYWSGMKP